MGRSATTERRLGDAAAGGLGHSSPVVWGRRVFVTTAVSTGDRIFRPKVVARDGEVTNVDSAGEEPKHRWKLMCFDLGTGRILGERVVHEGVPRIKRHIKNSHASATPVTDGRTVVVYFGSEGLYAYDMDGRLRWRADLGLVDVGWPYDPDYQWGVASSPVIHANVVIVQCDNQEDSFIAGVQPGDRERSVAHAAAGDTVLGHAHGPRCWWPTHRGNQRHRSYPWLRRRHRGRTLGDFPAIRN